VMAVVMVGVVTRKCRVRREGLYRPPEPWL
jgi:hypothetical protein